VSTTLTFTSAFNNARRTSFNAVWIPFSLILQQNRERERQTRRKIGDTFEYESIKIIKIIYNIIFYLFLPLKVDFTASVIAEDN